MEDDGLVWAKMVIKTHCHGEVFLWRKYRAAFLMDFQLKTLRLIVSSDVTRISHIKHLFSKLKWEVVDQSVGSISHSAFDRLLSEIKTDAAGRAVVDYGQELIIRSLIGMGKTKTFIVFNVKKRRPGCVNIQASMGGNVPDFVSLFPSETWLTDIKGMQLYPIFTEWQLPFLSRTAIQAFHETA